MSADNWADCPRCAKRREEEIAHTESQINAAYGHVPVAEFDQKRADLEKLKASRPDPTFREDYEIYGAEDGVVKVVYSGRCSTCGLALKFEHEHELDVEGRS